jgi:hypothetical protein
VLVSRTVAQKHTYLTGQKKNHRLLGWQNKSLKFFIPSVFYTCFIIAFFFSPHVLDTITGLPLQTILYSFPTPTHI